MADAAKTVPAAGDASFWMARAETTNTESMAFGPTPGKALEALVDAWILRHCPLTGADRDLPWTMREDIVLVRAEPGRGYVIGPTDQAWFPASLRGDDPALSDAWDALSERHGIAAAPAP